MKPSYSLVGVKSGPRVYVYPYECGLLFRNGKFVREVGAGVYWTLFGSVMVKVDLRETESTMASQEILTSDYVPLRMSLVYSGHVSDAQRWWMKAQDPAAMLYITAQLALRSSVATRTFAEVMADRGVIGAEVLSGMQATCTEFGFACTQADVRDVTLPATLKRAYTATEAARQEGLAALERARGESAALRSLANASRVLQGNPELLALRTLQSIEQGSGNLVLLNRLLQPGREAMSPRQTHKNGDED